MRPIHQTEEEFQKTRRKRSPFYVAMGFLFVAALLLFGYIAFRLSPSSQEMNRIPMEGVYYLNGDTDGVSFSSIDEIRASQIHDIRLKGYLTEPIAMGEKIFFFVHRETVSVTINGENVFLESGEWNQMWYYFESTGMTTADEIEITITGMDGVNASSSIVRTLQRVYYGDRYDLFRQQIFRNAVKIALSLFILAMGLAELLITAGMILMDSADVSGGIGSGLVMITGAICCFINYEYINLIILDAELLFTFDVLMQIAVAFCVMITLLSQMKSRKNWERGIFALILWTVILAIFLIMRFVFEIEVSDVLWSGFLVGEAGGFIAIEMILMLLDFRQNSNRTSAFVALGNLILAISFIAEIAHFVITYYYSFYAMQTGLIIYALMQYYVLYARAAEKERMSKRTVELEHELVESQITTMLSQIRPHFLYNSITAIQMLCVEDPERAQKSLGDFAKYLRGNMDSLASRDLIPFEKELEHTRHYVELELLRQGEYLQVDYRIEETDFMIPALTLQPLVENAIKHGLTPKEDGGKVEIETKRMGSDVVLVVTDDGVGFDPSEKKGEDPARSHIGMENVRDRVELMAGGRMEVESEVGIGTKVTIVLPQEDEK